MMNRRSFLQTSAVGLPAFGALTLASPVLARGSDPIAKHMLKESLKAYKLLQSGNPSREAQGLRLLGSNARLLRAHGQNLGLRTKFIEAQQFIKAHPQQAKTQAAAAVTRMKTVMAQYGINKPIGNPLAFATAYPNAIIDLDKFLPVLNRLFEGVALDRDQPLRPAAFRGQETVIDVCISNVDEPGGCEIHQEEICKGQALMKMVLQASVLFFSLLCGAECWEMAALFQIDLLALSVMSYWSGC